MTNEQTDSVADTIEHPDLGAYLDELLGASTNPDLESADDSIAAAARERLEKAEKAAAEARKGIPATVNEDEIGRLYANTVYAAMTLIKGLQDGRAWDGCDEFEQKAAISRAKQFATEVLAKAFVCIATKGAETIATNIGEVTMSGGDKNIIGLKITTPRTPEKCLILGMLAGSEAVLIPKEEAAFHAIEPHVLPTVVGRLKMPVGRAADGSRLNGKAAEPAPTAEQPTDAAGAALEHDPKTGEVRDKTSEQPEQPAAPQPSAAAAG